MRGYGDNKAPQVVRLLHSLKLPYGYTFSNWITIYDAAPMKNHLVPRDDDDGPLIVPRDYYETMALGSEKCLHQHVRVLNVSKRTADWLVSTCFNVVSTFACELHQRNDELCQDFQVTRTSGNCNSF